MKIIFLLLIAAFLYTSSLFAFGKTGNENSARKVTVKIKCEKMHCDGCKATITEALQSIDGVTKISIDLKTKIIKVTFDNTKTDRTKISEKILAAGYENEIIS